MSDWDAGQYDKVSSVQLAWGKNVLAKRAWKGSETVLDAGCGSGNLAEIIAARIPRGRLYAVDKDPGMVRYAREKLVGLHNVQVIQADLADVKLPEKVDVVFSNAVLHWVQDHAKAFANFCSLLNKGGEFLAQCGGQGNVAKAIALLDGISAGEPFAQYFGQWQRPWHFAGPQETEKLLHDAGFRKVAAHLSIEPATFAGREQFSSFVRTAVIWPYLARLPAALQEQFLEAYLAECERLPQKWVLDYVRLNIFAEK